MSLRVPRRVVPGVLAAILGIVSVGLLTTPALSAQSPPDCEQWNTVAYFDTATPEEVTACLDAGADLEPRGNSDRTPLHWAAGNSENPAVIEALLAAGADPAARTEYGYTPLHLAAQYNENEAVIAVLLAAGADLEAQDNLGNTPLHLAAAYNANPVALEVLLAAGADPMARHAWGGIPLHPSQQRVWPAGSRGSAGRWRQSAGP